MLKKHFVLLAFMVMTIACANASTWKMHNSYVTTKINNIVDMGDKVYYLNSNHLFRFDKNTNELVALNKQNILSDSQVSQIYYDWERRLLFIAYVNSNIDVIDINGRLTNISNIKDVVMEVHNYSLSSGDLNTYTGKAIKDITFGGGYAYVTIGSGFFTINEETLQVESNYDMGQNICINSVALMGETLVILTNNRCYWGPPGDNDPIYNYQNVIDTYTGCKLYPIDDHSVFIYGSTAFGLHRCDFSSGTPVMTQVVGSRATNVQKTSTGFIANFAGQAFYYSINEAGTTATKQASVITCASSDPQGDGTVWVTDANGLHIKGSTTYYKINSLTTDAPYWLRYSAALNKLYVGVSGPNGITTDNSSVANVINTYDGVHWANATAYTANGGGYDFVFNPLDLHTYIRTSWNKGLFKVTNDALKLNYTTTNSPFAKYKPIPAFDKYGNLWVVSTYNAAVNCCVLPSDKVANSSVAQSDWFAPSGLNLATGSFKRSSFIVSKKNNMKIFCDGDFVKGAVTGHILCWDNGSEDPTVDNYQFANIFHFIDQNNKQIDWTYLTQLEEDKDGLIWAGHTLGLFVFDPDVLFDENPHATRPFATKFSEGKGYFCEGYSVYDIGIDRNNNKWIASNNGLYYVSPDGSEVYNHFMVDNSDIPSDMVYRVECDTVNDRVYIVTDNGFAEYIAHGDAAMLNYDEVYAFPNPVEPDFTGMIKIVNLMENSYVTITDRNNNVVAQFGPVMGSALWDGSGSDGERLPTGIYNIYAAQGSQPTGTGTPQATVMIIK